MQLVVFWSNFDEILLNNNIQKRIIFIQNKDIAAARLLGYSYGELFPQVLTTSCLSATSKLLHFVGLPQAYSKLTNSRRPACSPPPPKKKPTPLNTYYICCRTKIMLNVYAYTCIEV